MSREYVHQALSPHMRDLAWCVWDADSDLALHRTNMPLQDRNLGKRGRANYLHDQIWARVVSRFGECPVAELPDVDGADREDETKRQIHWFGGRIIMRVKKHKGRVLSVSCYPTQTANAFLRQNSIPVAGEQLAFASAGSVEVIRPINVILGYKLDQITQRMTDAVITYRVASKVHWVIGLPDPRGDTAMPSLPAAGPQTPPRSTIRPAAQADADEEDTAQ